MSDNNSTTTIHTTRAWYQPRIMWTIIKNTPTLDIFVALCNMPVMYMCDRDGQISSFVAIKKFPGEYELGTLFTFPAYRDRGQAAELVSWVVARYGPIGLLCKKDVVGFYERHGFVASNKCGFFLGMRRKLFNTFLRPLLGYPIVSMVYNKKCHTDSRRGG